MEQNEKREKLLWVSCSRFVAMLAVVIDHLHTIAYNSGAVVCLSYFSGITSYYSIQRHNCGNQVVELRRKLYAILIPYIIATFLYQVIFERFFSLSIFGQHLLRFDASGPFYFVIFYIQLIIIAPILYKLLKKCSILKHCSLGYLLLTMVVISISAVSINKTLIVDGYGGARYLFGGTYLSIYFFGMLFGHLRLQINSFRRKILIFSFGFVICSFFFCYMIKSQFAIDRYFPFGGGINPPGVLIMIYSLLVIVILYSLFSILECSHNNFVKRLLYTMKIIGDNSLYIFLYQEMVLRIVRFILGIFYIENFLLLLLIYIPLMMGIPVLIRILFINAKRRLLSD